VNISKEILKAHMIDVYSNSKNTKMENKRALQITKKIKKRETWGTGVNNG